MKAVVQDRYGPPDVLRIAELPQPEPRAGEVRVHILASTVSQTDTHARAAHPWIWRLAFGLRRPRWTSLGVEFAGVVDAVGPGVTQFAIGDEVFGQPRGFGAHAEYLVVPETAAMALKPAEIGFEDAAGVCEGMSEAIDALRRAGAGPGKRVAIFGASGSLGSAAVQLGKHLGAEITGVCSGRNVELVRSLGADVVVDYVQEDFRKHGPFDAIIDAVGKYTFSRARTALRPGGIYVATDAGPYLENVIMLIPARFVGSRRLVFGLSRRRAEDVRMLKELMEASEFRPVIDRRYALEEVAAAHRYVETWRKAGNVVLVMPSTQG